MNKQHAIAHAKLDGATHFVASDTAIMFYRRGQSLDTFDGKELWASYPYPKSELVGYFNGGWAWYFCGGLPEYAERI